MKNRMNRWKLERHSAPSFSGRLMLCFLYESKRSQCLRQIQIYRNKYTGNKFTLRTAMNHSVAVHGQFDSLAEAYHYADKFLTP